MRGKISSLPPPKRWSRPNRGQSVLEYAVFLAVVAAALLGMSTYITRAIQANLKGAEDQINAEAVK